MPISSVFPIFIYPLSQEHLIESLFFTITFFAIPLVVINLITEMLQENNTFLFFVFSIFVLLAYMFLTLFTVWLIVFFWSIVPSWLITLPILRWHYLYYKEKEFIEIDSFNI